MAHARQQIRDFAIAQATGLPTTGANVFNARLPSEALEMSQLPCWILSPFEGDAAETVERDHGGPTPGERRTIDLVFVGLAAGLQGVDLVNALDDMAVELEAVLADAEWRAIAPSGNGPYCQITDTTYDAGDDATSDEPGRITVIFKVEYFTANGAADTIL